MGCCHNHQPCDGFRLLVLYVSDVAATTSSRAAANTHNVCAASSAVGRNPLGPVPIQLLHHSCRPAPLLCLSVPNRFHQAKLFHYGGGRHCTYKRMGDAILGELSLGSARNTSLTSTQSLFSAYVFPLASAQSFKGCWLASQLLSMTLQQPPADASNAARLATGPG